MFRLSNFPEIVRERNPERRCRVLLFDSVIDIVLFVNQITSHGVENVVEFKVQLQFLFQNDLRIPNDNEPMLLTLK